MDDTIVEFASTGKGTGACVNEAGCGSDGIDIRPGDSCCNERSALRMGIPAPVTWVFDLPPFLRAVDDLAWSPFLPTVLELSFVM